MFTELIIPLSNKVALSLLYFTIFIFPLPYYFIHDFSSIFPKRLQFETFFDLPGLQESMRSFTEQELISLNIPENYVSYQDNYYNNINEAIKNTLGQSKYFKIQDGFIYAKGEVTFNINKIGGLQNYHIEKSEGEMTIVSQPPKRKAVIFKTMFKKLESPNDYLSVSVHNALIKKSLILKPIFKQLFPDQYLAQDTLFDHTVQAITKIKLFPFPKINRTIYLYEYNGHLVPIAYAIYSF